MEISLGLPSGIAPTNALTPSDRVDDDTESRGDTESESDLPQLPFACDECARPLIALPHAGPTICDLLGILPTHGMVRKLQDIHVPSVLFTESG